MLICCEETDAGKRLDVFLAEAMPEHSRSYLQKLIKDQLVLVNGQKAKNGLRLDAEDRITIDLPAPKELEILPENIPLEILYEDDDLLIVNKPKGMVVHPAPGHMGGTLVNALLYHCKDSLSGINGILRPGIVHRIDRDTTDSLIVCKNDAAHRNVAAQLAVHSITRRYRAIVHGNLPLNEGTIHEPIGRHSTDRKKMTVHPQHGKDAVTHYTVLERFGSYTYIECSLETGRTHQIRVHMSSIGHPLLGDLVYGSRKEPAELYGIPLNGQTLHAMTIGLIHPSKNEYMEWSAPLPEYFTALLTKLRENAR